MIKNRIIKAALLLAALVLQFSLVQRLTVFSFSANLCVLTLIGVCFFSSPAEAAVFGGVYGLLLDGAVGRSFGINVLLLMYLAVGVKLVTTEKINNSPAIMAVYVWFFTLVYYLAYGLLSLAVPRGAVGPGRWLLTAFVTATINCALSLPALWVTDRVRRGGAGA